MTSTPDDRETRPAAVLELRVHGVSNTPPPAMLDLPAAGLTSRGDELGGFWAPTHDAVSGLAPRDRGWVPPGIRREAYSWGGMARSSPPGVGPAAAKAAVALVARIGWILLMPFGIANLAFWARVPRPGGTAGRGSTPARPGAARCDCSRSC